MFRTRWALALVGLAFGTSCAGDTFTRNEPRLDLAAYTQGQVYESVDDTQHHIHLGTVPVFATKWGIFEMRNDTPQPLRINAVDYVDSAGQVWKPARWVNRDGLDNPDRPFAAGGQEFPLVINPYEGALLGIPYSPLEEGDHYGDVRIDSNAGNADGEGYIYVKVFARAVFTGAPDLEVEYNGYVGPNPTTDCVDTDTDGIVDGCAIPIENGLDFGNIGLGSTGTVRLVLRNAAQCTPYEGVDACSLCSLTIAKDETRQNVGLGFKAGTNEDGRFAFQGSTATPFDIRQRNMDAACSEGGEVRLLLTFTAPMEEGAFDAVVVVESNDPDEPLIEIPLHAAARNAPVAVAKFRELDPSNPSADYTNPNDIEPLERVFFDGRDSWDPQDPTDPSRIGAYLWEVLEYPTGCNPADFAHQGQNSSLYSFWLPLAGHYVVRLTVWNTDGIQSGDTETSRVEFDAVPGDAIHVQLVWDNSSNDQDLHLSFVNQDDRVCNIPWDCHWLNKTPSWFSTSPTGDGANPSLDIDDTNGLGPENINIDTPEPGVYRVYVHYYGDWNSGSTSPTRETIRIYLNGVQVAEYRRTLTVQKAIWAVADITWQTGGTGFVTPYPSDAEGEIGSVSVMSSCSSPGFELP